MLNNNYFETKLFWTNKKILIPINKILKIENCSTIPWKPLIMQEYLLIENENY